MENSISAKLCTRSETAYFALFSVRSLGISFFLLAKQWTEFIWIYCVQMQHVLDFVVVVETEIYFIILRGLSSHAAQVHKWWRSVASIEVNSIPWSTGMPYNKQAHGGTWSRYAHHTRGIPSPSTTQPSMSRATRSVQLRSRLVVSTAAAGKQLFHMDYSKWEWNGWIYYVLSEL